MIDEQGEHSLSLYNEQLTFRLESLAAFEAAGWALELPLDGQPLPSAPFASASFVAAPTSNGIHQFEWTRSSWQNIWPTVDVYAGLQGAFNRVVKCLLTATSEHQKSVCESRAKHISVLLKAAKVN